MSCMHCSNIVGRVYTHHLSHKIWCNNCGEEQKNAPYTCKVRYGGLRSDGLHVYDRIDQYRCESCRIVFDIALYQCEDNKTKEEEIRGEIMDVSELLRNKI